MFFKSSRLASHFRKQNFANCFKCFSSLHLADDGGDTVAIHAMKQKITP